MFPSTALHFHFSKQTRQKVWKRKVSWKKGGLSTYQFVSICRVLSWINSIRKESCLATTPPRLAPVSCTSWEAQKLRHQGKRKYTEFQRRRYSAVLWLTECGFELTKERRNWILLFTGCDEVFPHDLHQIHPDTPTRALTLTSINGLDLCLAHGHSNAWDIHIGWVAAAAAVILRIITNPEMWDFLE